MTPTKPLLFPIVIEFNFKDDNYYIEIVSARAPPQLEEQMNARSTVNKRFTEPSKPIPSRAEAAKLEESKQQAQVKTITTTAWKQSRPICDRIIDALLAEPTSAVLSRPPPPEHQYYSEIMDDYIDFNIVKKRLADGQYMSMFGFKHDMNCIWDKASLYYSSVDP